MAMRQRQQALVATGSNSDWQWWQPAVVAKGISGKGHQQRHSCNSTMQSGEVAEEGNGRWLDNGLGALLDNAN